MKKQAPKKNVSVSNDDLESLASIVVVLFGTMVVLFIVGL